MMKYRIKKLLARIITLLFSINRQISWIFQYIFFQPSTKKNTLITFSYTRDKFLVLIPHADDELIGCFQLIKSNPKATQLFYFEFTGSDTSSQNIIKRGEELKLFCDQLGLHLTVSEGNYQQELASIITSFQPNYLVIPSFVDWHPEHIRVNTILKDLLVQHLYPVQICQYQVTVPIDPAFITHVVPMNRNDQNNKWKLFATIYKSQKTIPILRFKLQEKINGSIVSAYAAEVFSVDTVENWSQNLTIITKPINNVKLSTLYKFINNIPKIRHKSYEMFTQLSRNNLEQFGNIR